MSGTITFAIIGAGQRGRTYARHIHESSPAAKVVAAAEPNDEIRNEFAKKYHLAENMVFSDFNIFFEKPKLTDVVVIATQDHLHFEPTILAAEKKYHILLEKPLAQTFAQCQEMIAAIKENKVYFELCHVLRYAPIWKKIKDILNSGIIGETCSIHHFEGIGWWHYAHSYVRGNWSREQSNPIILAKTSHDIDLILWWSGASCQKVASFGQLKHFMPANRPPNAADRCMDCKYAETGCVYSAKRFYFDQLKQNSNHWTLRVISSKPDRKSVQEALEKTSYGKCVYMGENDQMDTQHLLMYLDNGVTAEMTLSAFTPHGKQLRVMASKGYLECDGQQIRVHDFLTGSMKVFDQSQLGQERSGGHYGGDKGIIDETIRTLKSGDISKSEQNLKLAQQSLLTGFAVHKARLESRVIKLDEVCNDIMNTN